MTPQSLQLPLILAANLIQFIFLLLAFFYLLLSLRAFGSCRKPVSDGLFRRFAVILPAYNEETVIGFAIDSLLRMDYPADKFDIFIVADHCTDRTIELARASGVTVLEHSGPGKKSGKGRALKWACALILDMKKHDALCYFDADSLAHPGFLLAMNARLASGDEAVQGHHKVKNTDSWVARTLASERLLFTRLHRSKQKAGLSAILSGKGMCFSRKVSEAYPWDDTSLTEDMELQMRLIRHGIRIAWDEDAIVYDEEPSNLRQYMKRNIRWTRGTLDTARLHLAGLWARAVLHLDLKALDGGLYCIKAYRLPIIAFMTALMFYTRDSFNLFIWLYNQFCDTGIIVKIIFIFFLVSYRLWGLLKEPASPDIFAASFLQPFLVILRLPIFIAGVFRNRTDWGRTEHTSQVTISTLAKEYVAAGAATAQASLEE
ncbi:MAG: hypothetical protein A2234_05445 [Elusimicrobia bacterium RIFOXYA2_FULL_58_8]|nr:MAG: hypothetical protein A2234_05445 [Elusimicrobia bacterium RIFOXYA2_FULL_58_8]